ncbi:MAG: histidine-type phosphatase [Azospirillaceae bacterium]|nr:histidine-type phosphatase [Azospirillaceae bacterium]
MAALLLATAPALAAPPPAAPADQLEGVVILMRHSVRSYMNDPRCTSAPQSSCLDSWSKEPWPLFSVPPGNLTERGFQLAKLLGAYYGEHYRALGMLPADKCNSIWVHANRTQRTIKTGEALAAGLAPTCDIHVDTVAEGQYDPLFDPVPAGATHLDMNLALASVQGRIGDAKPWTAAWAANTEALQTLLLDCKPERCKTEIRNGGPLAGRQLLTEVPTSLSIGTSAPVDLNSPVSSGATLTDSLLMAYAEGFPESKLAGGRLTLPLMNQVEALNEANWDIRLRTPYMARVGATPLLQRIVSLLSGDGAPFSVLVGHDGNVILLGGLLRMDWAMTGYQPGEVPPASGLVFERWRRGSDGKIVIRARYTTQSLQQLREAKVLTEEHPPLASPVFIPGCSESGLTTMDCPLETLHIVAFAATHSPDVP